MFNLFFWLNINWARVEVGWDVQVLYYNKIDGRAMKFYIERKIIVDPGLETDRTNQGKRDNQTETNYINIFPSMINILPSLIINH